MRGEQGEEGVDERGAALQVVSSPCKGQEAVERLDTAAHKETSLERRKKPPIICGSRG